MNPKLILKTQVASTFCCIENHIIYIRKIKFKKNFYSQINKEKYNKMEYIQINKESNNSNKR